MFFYLYKLYNRNNISHIFQIKSLFIVYTEVISILKGVTFIEKTRLKKWLSISIQFNNRKDIQGMTKLKKILLQKFRDILHVVVILKPTGHLFTISIQAWASPVLITIINLHFPCESILYAANKLYKNV